MTGRLIDPNEHVATNLPGVRAYITMDSQGITRAHKPADVTLILDADHPGWAHQIDALARELEQVRAENAVLAGRLDVEVAGAWAEEADLAAQRMQAATEHLKPEDMLPEEHAAVVTAYAAVSRAYAALASVRLAATADHWQDDADRAAVDQALDDPANAGPAVPLADVRAAVAGHERAGRTPPLPVHAYEYIGGADLRHHLAAAPADGGHGMPAHFTPATGDFYDLHRMVHGEPEQAGERRS